MSEFKPDHLTWTHLLAQCLRLAQASVALPKDAEGERWRASIPAIINLTAVTFALNDFARIDPAERALALDKAELLIQGATEQLTAIWLAPATQNATGAGSAHVSAKADSRGSQFSPALEEVVLDAHGALANARACV